MLKRLFFITALTCALAATGFAQNASNSNSTRQRTSTATPKTPAQSVEEAGTAQAEPTPQPTPRTPAGRRGRARGSEPPSKEVMAVFNSILDGIRSASVDTVTGAYWNSPQFVRFNNNGSVTKGWAQMRSNLESSYPKLKDVKLETRDVNMQMLGSDGAVVSFLWTQSQTTNGVPETATGRTTLVFRRIGTAWKVVHAHISPDSPDSSRIFPSERTTPTPTPTPKP